MTRAELESIRARYKNAKNELPNHGEHNAEMMCFALRDIRALLQERDELEIDNCAQWERIEELKAERDAAIARAEALERARVFCFECIHADSQYCPLVNPDAVKMVNHPFGCFNGVRSSERASEPAEPPDHSHGDGAFGPGITEPMSAEKEAADGKV